MKHKLLLTVVAVFSFVVSFAQSKEDLISVNISDKPLSEAVRVIENATRFTFFYDTEKTDMTQKVSLSAANLTVEEVSLINESFVSTLNTMYHGRVPYPKDEKNNENNLLFPERPASGTES